ncbi:hypothetical protein N9N03_00685 [Chlamydiia bacterium]|nr:hypothetical protein [Chlamydiia bacterium]
MANVISNYDQSMTTSITSRKMNQIVRQTHDLTFVKMVGLVIKIAGILFLSTIETLYVTLSALKDMLTLNMRGLKRSFRTECCVIASIVSCVVSLARICIMREPISIYLDAANHTYVYYNNRDRANTNSDVLYEFSEPASEEDLRFSGVVEDGIMYDKNGHVTTQPNEDGIWYDEHRDPHASV